MTMKTKSFILAAIIVAFACTLAIGGGPELNFAQKIWAAISTNLDTTISSRASATYWTSARATKVDNLDAAISTRAASSTAVSNAYYTNARGSKLDYLDVAVSGRYPNKGEDLQAINTNTTSTSDTTILNATGPGRLISLVWRNNGSTSRLKTLKVTIDGGTERTLISSSTYDGATTGYIFTFNARFLTSCVVKVAGDDTSPVYHTLIYSTDK